MDLRAALSCIFLAIAATASPARPGTEVGSAGEMSDTATATASASTNTQSGTNETDSNAALDTYQRNQRALYDALTTDPSPRVQVLAGRVYVDDDATPSALRPKQTDVVTRAAQLAPDDVFVQWMAASSGSYASSSCGPTKWPEAEVANLLGLEPDNAAAWQFGVALARAKGDEAGVDDALSRMAAVSRADDHLVDEIATWTGMFVAHPEIAGDAFTPYSEYVFALPVNASLAAMEHVGTGESHADNALKAVCTPDGSAERTWRRLGWCADAGHLLAEKGTSLALRKSGLAMLAATGDESEETSKTERQTDWFEANSANPMRHFFDDDPADLPAALADWHGAKSEIAAIEHRLKRLGKPSTPPAGWTKAPEADYDETKAGASTKAFAEYLALAFQDMRGSASAEARLFAASNEEYLADLAEHGADGTPKPVDVAASQGESIATIAAANATNLKVQWLTAGAQEVPDETRANAIATVQQAESDNAAAWALSLGHASGSDALVDTLLQRMAASTRYDMHIMYGVSPMLEAMQRRPVPPELAETPWTTPGREISADDVRKGIALSIGYMSFAESASLTQVCQAKNAASASTRRDACVAIGKLLVQKGMLVTDVRVGEGILRRLNAADAAGTARVRHVEWWYDVMTRQERVQSVGAYLDDYIRTGNEVEALERNAEGRGKTEPPANWKSRGPITID